MAFGSSNSPERRDEVIELSKNVLERANESGDEKMLWTSAGVLAKNLNEKLGDN